MQFAHSGSKPEKQPPPHPALSYDATAGAPHSAESALSHGAAPRSLQTPHLHHPTAPRSRLFTPLHPYRVRIVPSRRTRAYSQHCTCALHGAVSISTHGAVPAPHHAAKPHAAHSTAPGPPRPPSALLQSCRKSGNKKVIKIATFLRLAIAADVQITDRAPKMKQNDRPVPHFHFTGDEKEPLIAKKLQKRQDFCFRKANYRNRSRFRNEPIAKGKSRNELIAATRRTPMNNART